MGEATTTRELAQATQTPSTQYSAAIQMPLGMQEAQPVSLAGTYGLTRPLGTSYSYYNPYAGMGARLTGYARGGSQARINPQTGRLW